MRAAVTRIFTALAVIFAAQGEACAHALGQRYDLPLPLGYYLLASGAAVAVSFVILAIFLRHPSGVHARDFLGSWSGKLVCDDYSG